MQYHPIGTTFEVSEVGLGCWQLGADWGDAPSSERAHGILRAAVDGGVRFFDTADVYGDGRSERLIGGFIARTGGREDLRVATKFGRGGDVFPDGYTEAKLRRAVRDSRERLGVETIDLLQLHCIPMAVMQRGEIWGWLRELRSEGLIHDFGASVETVEEGLFCLEQEGIASLQIILNLFRQKPLEELVPRAAERGVGIIARVPLASGLLTGKFSKDTEFAKSDHRNFNRDGEAFNVGETFAGLPFEKGVELAQKLGSDYLPEDMSMAGMSIRWLLDQPGVSSVIAGASSELQARQNASAADLPPLSEELHAGLREFYDRDVKSFIRGPY